MIFLTSIAFGLYTLVAVPLLRYHETHDRDDVQAAAYILGLWVGTALVYPVVARFAAWMVDKILLRRKDYGLLLREITSELDSMEDISGILDAVREKVASALTAKSAEWKLKIAKMGMTS